jgi:hypothetical protein
VLTAVAVLCDADCLVDSLIAGSTGVSTAWVLCTNTGLLLGEVAW